MFRTVSYLLYILTLIMNNGWKDVTSVYEKLLDAAEKYGAAMIN